MFMRAALSYLQRPARPICYCLMVLAVWSLTVRPSEAQYSGRRVPTASYYSAFHYLYDAEYRRSLKIFQSECRGSIKSATARWIDSICYHAMAGECYYEMGQLPEALENYTAAINLYLAYPKWLTSVQFPDSAIQPVRKLNPRQQVTWGKSKRTAQPASFATMMPIAVGRLDAGRAYKEGGVVAKPMLININVGEIVRCTTLAIRRRTELLGPTCRHDPLTAKLLVALSGRPAYPNHWSECWIDVQLGLAQLAAGKQEQGTQMLQRSILAAGQYDHPMTAVALFELGRVAMARGDLKSAENYFMEATYSAAFHGDIRMVEEAFRYGAAVHLVTQPKTFFEPLTEALRWAKQNRYRELACSLLVSMAENHAALGQTAPAALELKEAAKGGIRNDMAVTRLGARHAFVGARIFYQQNNITAGGVALAKAMDYMSHGSLWRFHVTLVDAICVGGSVTPRTATNLYQEVLRDPNAEDWSFRPEESLASLLTSQFLPLEHWFELVLGRKNQEVAMEISDRVRRRRFYASLPFGGRAESLRWILEGPQEALPASAQLQSRDLRTAFPQYDTLSKEAAKLRALLRQNAPVPKDPKERLAQEKQFAQLATLSTGQEALLREMAVSRLPADLVFPPLRSTADVQKSLPDGTALLAFFSTRRGIYAFLMNNARYDFWLLGSPGKLKRKISTMLRTMGQYDANHQLAADDLSDKRWQKAAQGVLKAILEGSQADFSTSFDQLIIVPDGVLWYVPFEALQVKVDGQSESLISRFQIRYAPTIGLAVPDGRRRKNVVRTGVMVGRLFPSDNEAVAQQAFDDLSKVVPGAIAIPEILPAGSALYRTLFDELIVYDDILAGRKGAYSWQPMPVERPKQGGTLNDWLSLPLGSPQTVMLPGFHTAAERGLKRIGTGPIGEEMFLSVCGLMASGTRTMLISRWRTGGTSSYTMVREFAQELPHTTPAEAWQRAIMVVRDSHLQPEEEPRVKSTGAGDTPKLEHPFFWAGYMLINPGESPPEKLP